VPHAQPEFEEPAYDEQNPKKPPSSHCAPDGSSRSTQVPGEYDPEEDDALEDDTLEDDALEDDALEYDERCVPDVTAMIATRAKHSCILMA